MFSIYSRMEYAEKLEAAQKEIMRLNTIPRDADRIKELEKENAELRLQLDDAYKQRDDLFSCLHRHHVKEGIAAPLVKPRSAVGLNELLDLIYGVQT